MSHISKLRPVKKETFDASVSSLELHDGVTLKLSSTCAEACQYMHENKLLSLAVEENNKLFGFFSMRFFMREVLYRCVDVNIALGDIIYKNPVSIQLDDPFYKVLEQCNYRPEAIFPVVNEEQKVIHNFWMKEIINNLCLILKDTLDGIDEVTESNFWKLLPEDDYDDYQIAEDEMDLKNLVSPLKQLLGSRPIISEKDLSVAEVTRLMVESNSNMFIMTKYGVDMLGVVTDRVLFNHFHKTTIDQLENEPISKYLVEPPKVLLEDHLVAQGLIAFRKNSSRRMIIVDNDLYPLKVIEPVDIIRHLNFGFLSNQSPG